ncbi:MAG: hypothetical protein ACPGQL_02425 [Thermoplasmatota archaeon]
MSPWPQADEVRVLQGLKERFLKRHKKDRQRAEAAWEGLVARAGPLAADVQMGEPIPKRLRPAAFQDHHTLYLIPELPHRFRAIYEVSSASPLDPIVVTIVWIGDHHEYDALFGYRTS